MAAAAHAHHKEIYRLRKLGVKVPVLSGAWYTVHVPHCVGFAVRGSRVQSPSTPTHVFVGFSLR